MTSKLFLEKKFRKKIIRNYVTSYLFFFFFDFEIRQFVF